MSRLHGHQPDESRAIQITFDGLAHVDSSARFSFGPISALSSVSGPIEVRLASKNTSQATFKVLVRPLSNVPATEAKALAAIVRGLLAPSLILANNPWTLVQIVAQALAPSGPKSAIANMLTAALVNASMLALLNAGSIPMRGAVCAISVSRQKDTRALVVDPDKGDGVLDANGCFAFMLTQDRKNVQAQYVWTNWKQSAGDESVLNKARELASRAVGDVYTAIHASVENMGKAESGVMLPVQKEDATAEDHGNDDKMEI